MELVDKLKFKMKNERLSKIVIFTFAFFILTSCTAISHPTPYGIYRGMDGNAPAGTETFRKGWHEGCISGMAATGSLHYKWAYDYTYDASMVDNNEYHDSWKKGYSYCRWYTTSWK